ncbi:MAG TPA: homocysteine biosynthesis protein [Bacteroidales bacterium]|nr:homocysteine biosynthesis protein [Bacteroidales bacterium]
MSQTKSFSEINEKISKGEAVVLTAEEFKRLAKECTPDELVKKVDVVTTATFGPMCSSGAFINFGHSQPPIRMEKVTLNDVPVCSGVAAVDAYIGATEVSPYNERYGGAHIIEELIAGKDITLKATGKGTDCYPRKEIETKINKDTVNEFYMFNPRNAYQNYAAAVNSTNKIKYTYMGSLLPNFGNLTYSTSGELSPLLNDPLLRTIGIGTRIFLAGAEGFVAWNGTQFNTSKPRNEYDIPTSNATTLAVIGNAKDMSTQFLRAAYFEKYGVSIFIGIGIPIPVLDEDMARRLSITNEHIETHIVDYGIPDHPALAKVNYAQLQSGSIEFNGKQLRTAPLSSMLKAREIAQILKEWIMKNEFQLSEPVKMFPQHSSVQPLIIR